MTQMSALCFSLFSPPLEPLVSELEHIFKHSSNREAFHFEVIKCIVTPGNNCCPVEPRDNYIVFDIITSF